ncbi:hypothetical protein FHR24_001640 [Wenyingzhuangia heitensis]|uniref:LETM1-like protein n=1 Tax=Wenyingzhuangia heitensis TaxID=1487859 RepID=A0ABX0UCC8_9FLAO|nr:hypothetical protein [Wenyingzhuangia heitensis]NIJ45201.1 hypothetical protein [Wenyingzhuangia heitensis]
MNEKKASRSYRIFKLFIEKNRVMVTHALDIFFNGLKTGASDTKKTRLIIQAYVTTGKITKEEEKFIKFYAFDMLKIAGIGIPFVLLPGASIIIPFVIKAAEKRNIDLMPSNFKNKSK